MYGLTRRYALPIGHTLAMTAFFSFDAINVLFATRGGSVHDRITRHFLSQITRICLIFVFFFNKNSCVMALFGVGGSGSYMKIRRTYKRNDQGDGLWIYQQNGGC